MMFGKTYINTKKNNNIYYYRFAKQANSQTKVISL